jgi:putative two-component system response regulator
MPYLNASNPWPEPVLDERASLLVVDDTPANLSLMAGLLHQAYRVRLANSGARALELARREPPDLILLDVMMPEMDGYTVCRQLKLDERTRDVPVIFVTAMSQPDDETRGFECGGADFIHKPFSPPIVQSRVATQLEPSSGSDTLHQRSPGCSRSCSAVWPRWSSCATPRCT